MVKKKKIEKPKHKPTRRQLSRWQKQKRRQRFIIGIGVSVILVALGLVWAGVYYQWYVPQQKPYQETVIEVNNSQFNMAYYIDAMNYRLEGLSSEYVSYYLDMIVESIQQGELIKQESAEMGITISDEEVDEEIKNSELPDNQAVRDTIGVELLIQKLEEGYFSERVPISAEQRHIMAMFMESEKQANEVGERLLAGEDFGQLAGEMSLDDYTRENSGDLGWRPEGIIDGLLKTSVLEEYVFGSQVGEVATPVHDAEKTKKLGYWLIEVLGRNEEMGEAHVQAILLASEEEAQMIASRLSGDEDFAELAEEYSQSWSEENGADLGWLVEDDISDTFSEFIFNSGIELNTLSEPIRDEGISTKGGCWLSEVLDSEIRQISDEDRNTLIEQAMQDWVESLIEDPENIIISYLDDEMREFAVSKFSGS